jgi:hypothetical protein
MQIRKSAKNSKFLDILYELIFYKKKLSHLRRANFQIFWNKSPIKGKVLPEMRARYFPVPLVQQYDF